jgi:4-hydroxy-tetrahydrodipicolinate reductase
MADWRIGILGAAGRMGRMLIEEVARTPGSVLSAACEQPGHKAIGSDAGLLAGTGALGVTLGDDPDALFAACDAAIDFTSAKASAANAARAAARGKALVIGTTGLGEAELKAVREAASRTPLLVAPNMSPGVILLTALTEQVAKTLGDDYDVEIVEMHHRHKVDAPSGTALALGEAAARGRGIPLASHAVRARDGHTGARPRGAIGFATLRGGDVVGDHRVIFAGEGERIELAHLAANRTIYSRSAVRAALWLKGKPPGLYGMRDVLGL